MQIKEADQRAALLSCTLILLAITDQSKPPIEICRNRPKSTEIDRNRPKSTEIDEKIYQLLPTRWSFGRLQSATEKSEFALFELLELLKICLLYSNFDLGKSHTKRNLPNIAQDL